RFYSEPANQNTAGHNTGGDLRRPRPRDPDVVCVSGVCEAECCRSAGLSRSVALQEEFESAADRVRELVQTAPRDKLLYLYARYKQAKVGKCDTPKPGFFDFEGQRKWTSWKDLGDMSKEQAMQEYVSCVNELDPEGSAKVLLNPALSYMCVNVLHSKMCVCVCSVFQGRALLHWACDRGHKELVSLLLSNNADINCQVQQGLHVETSACEFAEIVELLLEAGADPSIKDSEGSLPEEVTESSSISSLLRQYTAPKG
uniref:Acyl-CoA-binding domain-containing protein 6 n=1 Tax=Astyanax mexicanus TaxID=7994 RepID=A0A8B9HEJ3_ASTMX